MEEDKSWETPFWERSESCPSCFVIRKIEETVDVIKNLGPGTSWPEATCGLARKRVVDMREGSECGRMETDLL